MGDRKPVGNYVVGYRAVQLGPNPGKEKLLARRDRLVERVLRMLPPEARPEIADMLSRERVALIQSVPSREMADCVSEINAIDDLLDPPS